MKHITGIDRHQTFITSLELHISDQNPVRFIDAFVAHIDLRKLGFQAQKLGFQAQKLGAKIPILLRKTAKNKGI